MTQQEMKKLRVIDSAIAGNITVREAAEFLDLSERQVFRLKKGVLEQGAAFIIHKNRGRKPSHAISDATKDKIVELKQSENYRNANFTHFQELLKEHEQIQLSYPTVYRALSQAGIVSPKKKRKRKNHHSRKRKEQEGLLVQIDASPHLWFGGVETSLHGAIDDATGKVYALHFEENECLKGYFEMTEQMINREGGLPVSFYNDRHTIFKSPKGKNLSIEQQLKGEHVNLTQFGTAMEELGINVIFAKSAPAKGRVERLWETLQSRLPVEFLIHGVTTIEEANQFLNNGYIDKFNAQFAVEPENPESALRPLDPQVDLSTILCIKEQRIVSDGSGFSYGGKYYQITNAGQQISLPHRTKITVLDSHKQDLRVLHNGVVYETNHLAKKPRKKSTQNLKKEAITKMPTRPAVDHPWKLPQQNIPRPFYDESDREILEALFDSTRAWA
jgi:transposase